MGASRVPGPHPPTTGPQSPANAKDSTASTSLRPNSISILWDQGVTPKLQKARERVSGEPLPDHLHNKAIQRRGLTPPHTPTPGRSATTRPGHISRLVPRNGPGLARRPPLGPPRSPASVACRLTPALLPRASSGAPHPPHALQTTQRFSTPVPKSHRSRVRPLNPRRTPKSRPGKPNSA